MSDNAIGSPVTSFGSKMDRSWIKLRDRFCAEYIQGVKSILVAAKNVLYENGTARCPCTLCRNRKFEGLEGIERHLFTNGMSATYDQWFFHGEMEVDSTSSVSHTNTSSDDLNVVTKLLREKDEIFDLNIVRLNASDDESGHIGLNEVGFEDKLPYLMKEAARELYPDCRSFSSFNFLMKLMHIKVLNNWSSEAFDMLLQLLKEAFPSDSILPDSYKESKKILCDLGLGYESIHACKNDCVLFRKEYAEFEYCPFCGESRYKVNDGEGKRNPQKVLHHFPLKPRLQRLFLSEKNASEMRWHKEKRVEIEGILRHPADAEGWKHFDREFPTFASDPRNVRFALASHEFNPFENISTSYNMWPIILLPYNLPPWMCMKESFCFMSLLIPGPKSPEKDIDVFLQPLIEELNELWNEGMRTYDSSTSEYFQLHVALLWTISDFPAYDDLSGWSTKGYKACPICLEDTSSLGLRSNICYMGHRRYLPMDHIWRKSKLHDGNLEIRAEPKIKSGVEILQNLNRLPFPKAGKNPSIQDRKRKRPETNLNWTKKSVFFSLPYWSKNLLRHKLDVMRIEKNICDNLVGTLFSINGKNKDTLKARLDLKDLKIRKELHVQKVGDTYFKPPAWYTLNASERIEACKFLKNVKLPDGFTSNKARCVDVNSGKLLGLESHDSHVLLQYLLPIAIRCFVHKDISTVITELSNFFRALCAKVIHVDKLNKLKDDIVIILCKLERIFPPAFFDIMIHLMVHLPYEAMIVGPVSYSWIYPIERNLQTLKQYVRNKTHPERSIAEAYIVNESLTFYSSFMQEIWAIYYRNTRNDDVGGVSRAESDISIFKLTARPIGRSILKQLPRAKIDKAHWYILNNCDEVQPYLRQHMDLLRQERSTINICKRQQSQFPNWFKTHVEGLRCLGLVSENLYALAMGPDLRARSYSECCVNGLRFHTLDRSRSCNTQNSGITFDGQHSTGAIVFYGLLNDVLEFSYINGNRVVIFKCEWFDLTSNRVHNDLGFISINTSYRWYKDEPFILANQARQVLYLEDIKYGRDWKVVQPLQHKNMDAPGIESSEENDANLHVIPLEIHVVETLEAHTYDRENTPPIVIKASAMEKAFSSSNEFEEDLFIEDQTSEDEFKELEDDDIQESNDSRSSDNEDSE